ncbi:MAG: HD domain-containing protein, partial [Clostridia bacterium]
MTDKFKEITDTVRKIFENNKGSHDWDHTERVLNMALKIAVLENADIDVVRYAAVLHDICRYEEDISKGLIHHEEKGAEVAKRILTENGIDDAVIEKAC